MTCGCVDKPKRHIVLTNVPPSIMKAVDAARSPRPERPARFIARHLNAEHGRLQRALAPLLKAYAAAVDEVLTRHGVYDVLPR